MSAGAAPGKAKLSPSPFSSLLFSGTQKFLRVNKSQKENESQWCLNYYYKETVNYGMFANVWIFHIVNSDGRNEKL